MSFLRDHASTDFKPAVIEASSVGCTARSRLKEGEKGTVQGVFDSAINIIFDKGLVSLVAANVENGPFNVTLKLPDGISTISSLRVSDGDKVSVKDSALKLNDMVFSFSSAGTYFPKQKFTAPILTIHELEANLQAAINTAVCYGNRAGLGELFNIIKRKKGELMLEHLNIFANAAVGRIIRLQQTLRLGEKSGLADAVKDLIGLGPGLTPSSDDMLAGLVLVCVLYAKNSGRKERVSRLLTEVIKEEVQGRTTIISEEFLKQAALGNGNEPAMKLCEALLTGGQSSVEKEVKHGLAIGDSSGTDMVLGMILGMMFCMDKPSGLEMRGST